MMCAPPKHAGMNHVPKLTHMMNILWGGLGEYLGWDTKGCHAPRCPLTKKNKQDRLGYVGFNLFDHGLKKVPEH